MSAGGEIRALIGVGSALSTVWGERREDLCGH